MDHNLGRVGIWRGGELDPALAREIEDLGYGSIWIGGSPGGDLAVVDELLSATDRIPVATGIVNVWKDDARPIAAAYHRLADRHPGRFVLGIGIGHPEADSDYAHPYESLVRYLDALDAEGVPVENRVLAALGPKVLRLARDRSAGAHPYLTTPEHTRQAREVLGPDRLLVPEQKVVVGENGRDVGRKTVAFYLGLTNYVANLKKLGFTDDDVAGEGSDALVDALVAHGPVEVAAQRVRAHLDAGADSVVVQLLTPEGGDELAGYRAVAEALHLTA